MQSASIFYKNKIVVFHCFCSNFFCYIEVLDIPHSLFEEKLEKLKNAKGVKLDTDLTASDLKDLVEQYKNVYVEAKGENFPSGVECNTANFFTFCCYTFSWF